MSLDLFDRINRERAARGIPALEWDMSVAASSAGWSREMARSGYRHDNFDWARARSGYRRASENIHSPRNGNEQRCFGEAAPPSTACGHLDWMKSEGHRRGLLDPRVTRAGIGVFCTSSGWFGTQRFLLLQGDLTPAQAEQRGRLTHLAEPEQPIVAANPTILRCN